MRLKEVCHHFGLEAAPFARPVPEPGLLRHKSFAEAFARVSLAIESRTAALLTAEPGTGKSTLLATIDASLDKSKMRLVYTQLCSCGPYGLIGQLAARYGVRPKRSSAQTAQVLLDELSRSDKTEILVLDEGHRLPDASLDELRLLSNTDFDRTPPFSLVLAGQPPLRARLENEPDHGSLWQRIPIRTSLAPLSDRETADYSERRLRAVGAQTMFFRAGAVDKLFEHSRGVARLVNNLGIGSLIAAATAGRKHVDVRDVDTAHFEMDEAR
jgi:type II secretory pathway predicted ATPase ExeA